jgi:DNA-binding LytR/AlgR family response regulator
MSQHIVALTIVVTSAIILLCISALVMYFSKRKKKQTAFQSNKLEIINFHDEKGTLRFSIAFCNLYYIESSDNYVTIYYESKDKITHFLLRRSMKSIEDQYTNYPLVRCHRSYIVNINKIKALRNDKEGIFLDLDYKDLPDIPISKTYSDHVMKIFNPL